ncbi:MAG TPA: hypothetical protein VK591_01770 [Xanthobacteraceae bacterium]|nr:hypothetical protein [Xanthobacteraceae bacterium]
MLVLPLSLALLLVAPMVNVEAPERMLISGQSISCVVPVTDCWDVAVEREKKPEILSEKDGELDAGGGAEVPVAGADEEPRRLVPEQPDASSATSSNVAVDAQRLRRITLGTTKPGIMKGVFRRIPQLIASPAMPQNLIPKEPWPSQGAICLPQGRQGGFG